MNIELIREIEIGGVMQMMGIQVSQKGTCLCPFHDDHHPSMKIYRKRNTCRCFVCGESFDSIALVRRMLGLGFLEACSYIGSAFGIACLDDGPRAKPRKLGPDRYCPKSDGDGMGTDPWGKAGTLRANRYCPKSDGDGMGTDTWGKARKLGPEDGRGAFPWVKDWTLDLEKVFPGIVGRYLGDGSQLCSALVDKGMMTLEEMTRAVGRYRLGCCRDGRVIFWLIDASGRVLDGKMMRYLSDGHRDRRCHPDWVVSSLSRARIGGIPLGYTSPKCFFGEHLLREDELGRASDGERIVAIVESEKTAIICSARFPGVIWLATGGMGMLSLEGLVRLGRFPGVRMVLFPDTDPSGKAYSSWAEVASRASKVLPRGVYVSDALERFASLEEKERKIDIADLSFSS